MNVRQRRAGQFELAAGFERDRPAFFLVEQADQRRAVRDRLPAEMVREAPRVAPRHRSFRRHGPRRGPARGLAGRRGSSRVRRRSGSPRGFSRPLRTIRPARHATKCRSCRLHRGPCLSFTVGSVVGPRRGVRGLDNRTLVGAQSGQASPACRPFGRRPLITSAKAVISGASRPSDPRRTSVRMTVKTEPKPDAEYVENGAKTALKIVLCAPRGFRRRRCAQSRRSSARSTSLALPSTCATRSCITAMS